MQKILHFTILAIFLSLLISCDNPNITVCVSVPEKGGFNCSLAGGKMYLLPYAKSDNYIALPAEDARTLIEKCYKQDSQ